MILRYHQPACDVVDSPHSLRSLERAIRVTPTKTTADHPPTGIVTAMPPRSGSSGRASAAHQQSQPPVNPATPTAHQIQQVYYQQQQQQYYQQAQQRYLQEQQRYQQLAQQQPVPQSSVTPGSASYSSSNTRPLPSTSRTRATTPPSPTQPPVSQPRAPIASDYGDPAISNGVTSPSYLPPEPETYPPGSYMAYMVELRRRQGRTGAVPSGFIHNPPGGEEVEDDSQLPAHLRRGYIPTRREGDRRR